MPIARDPDLSVPVDLRISVVGPNPPALSMARPGALPYALKGQRE